MVVGAAINMIGLGLTGFLYRTLFDINTKAVKHHPVEIPVLSNIRSSATSSSNRACWSTPRSSSCRCPLSALPQRLRARSALVGEHPRAADTVGISVSRIRYASCALGATLAAVGRVPHPLAHEHVCGGDGRGTGVHRAGGRRVRSAGSRGASSAHRSSSASSTGCSSICRR